MATWSGMRKRLEEDHLADCLRGRIQYFATTYRESHDREGRAAIRLDGEEILKGAYYNNVFLWEWCAPLHDPMDARKLDNGIFDQRSFYQAFDEFDNQSIEKSLASEDMLVRVFALLDRRVGKRRLLAMRDSMENEPGILRRFYEIRMAAEGLNDESNMP